MRKQQGKEPALVKGEMKKTFSLYEKVCTLISYFINSFKEAYYWKNAVPL